MTSTQARRPAIIERAPGPLRRILASHRAILLNASSLCGTSAATSVLGFGFWWLAARLFTPGAVGYGSAAVSAMTLLGTIGTLGLGTVLIGELARHPQGSGGLVSAALAASGTGTAAVAIGFVLVTPHLSSHPIPFAASIGTMLLFAAGAALTGTTAVLDEALVGLLLARLGLLRNAIFCGVKLAALAAVALVVRDQFGVSILTAWVIGSAVSIPLLAVLLRRRGIRVLHRPTWQLLRRLSGTASAHSWLNLGLQSPQAAIPIVATGLVSATAGASFYAAWMILSFAYIVPTHLSTVLYAVGATDGAALRREIRFTLRLSLLGGLIGVPVLVGCATAGLRLFGPSYAQLGAFPLRVLALGYFPMVFKVHYVAIRRVQGRIARAAALVTMGSLAELGAAAAGALTGGLAGLSIALLIAMCLEATLTAPAVLRAVLARRKGGAVLRAALARRKGAVLIVLIVCATLAGVVTTMIGHSPPVTLPGVSGKWRLTWADEFNGPANSAPDPRKWVPDIGGSWGEHELEYYTGSRKNAFQDGRGHLVIVARRENVDGYRCWGKPCQYTSARLTTQGTFTQQYGYFEARIKVPYGQGIWPAFWMLGDNIDSVGSPASGEIDVMENIGRQPSTVYGSAHGPPNGSGSRINSYQPGDRLPLSAGFHTYGVEWSPDSVSWYIDGKRYATYTKAQAAPGSWVYDHPFFLLLNVAVGGKWPGNPDSSTQFPQRMLVDYVRVYERAS